MTKKQKKTLARIIISAILLVCFALLPVEGYVRLCLFLIPYIIIGYDILKKAGKGIINRQVFDENFLMAVATVGAIILGEYPEGVAVMLFYQIGELFQSYAVGKSRRNISDLMDIRPDYANLVMEDGSVEEMDPEDVEPGSMILVKPGEKIPIDGIVAEGEASLDTRALTGESLPRHVKAEDEVISGCISMDGVLKIRTTREFADSTVSKILELVEESGMRKSKPENFITRFARYYTPIVCYAALILAVAPPLVRMGVLHLAPEWGDWIFRALTFLVISCPCALVISIPFSFFAGIGCASSNGILVKGSNYLELLSNTKTVVFDKTGTMTEGVFAVTEIVPADSGVSTKKLLEYAALAELYSSHPISVSLRDAWEEMPGTNPGTAAVMDETSESTGKSVKETNHDHDTDLRRVTDVHEISGKGVMARIDGMMVAVGNARLMETAGADCREVSVPGTVVHVAFDGKYAGHILISDRIKPTAKEAIDGLRESGVTRTVMLTGDARGAADVVAAELGVDEVHSELLPADKVEKIESILARQGQKNGRQKGAVAFVGDGINDAPVLSRADIGIAMGALGSDAAIESADIVLMDDDPAKIVKAIRISRKCLRIVYQNIWFAIGVKLVCLVLGALGIADMWTAIFADVGVMVIAVLNAIRALRIR